MNRIGLNLFCFYNWIKFNWIQFKAIQLFYYIQYTYIQLNFILFYWKNRRWRHASGCCDATSVPLCQWNFRQRRTGGTNTSFLIWLRECLEGVYSHWFNLIFDWFYLIWFNLGHVLFVCRLVGEGCTYARTKSVRLHLRQVLVLTLGNIYDGNRASHYCFPLT